VPSEYVREDGGVHAERRDLPLSWAVQKQGRIVRGKFWAFFPTETQTTVSGILNASQLFVAPFEGILRSDALHSGGSTFDIAAVVAIVGWTVLEFVVIKALAVFRRETV